MTRDAIEEAKELISGPAAWLDSWAQHVGNCKGGYICTCGLTAARTEAAAAYATLDALAAIEADGVRLVYPGEAPTQLIDNDERTTVRIFTPYAPPGG